MQRHFSEVLISTCVEIKFKDLIKIILTLYVCVLCIYIGLLMIYLDVNQNLFFPFLYPVIIRNCTFLHFIGVVCVYRYSNLTNVASKNNMNVKPQVLYLELYKIINLKDQFYNYVKLYMNIIRCDNNYVTNMFSNNVCGSNAHSCKLLCIIILVK